MGFLGGLGDVLMPPTTGVISRTKNKPLQKYIDSSVTGLGDLMSQNQSGLSDYISKYLANQGQAEKYTGGEIGAIDQFYNGDMARQLGALRSNYAKSLTDAADVASKQAIRSQGLSRLADQGSGSSYNTRLAMANLTPIRTQVAVQNAQQERNDLGYLTSNQLGLAGQRTKLMDTLAAYGLVPNQARTQNYQQNLGLMGNLTQLDQANKFYGLQQNRSDFSNFFDAADQGILNAASIYSSVGGGMKRGGLVRLPKGHNYRRNSYETGGKVDGPGTETSDSIPIHVSDNEYVMPAASVKIPGVLPLLEYIRHLGLNAAGIKEQPSKKKKGRYEFGGMTGGFDMGGMMGGGGGGFSTDMGGWGGMNTDMGGTAGFGDWANQFSTPGNAGQPQPQPQQSKPSSGGGGGLSGQAMALQARQDRSHTVQPLPSDLGLPEEQSPEELLQIAYTSNLNPQPYKPFAWGVK